MVLSSQLSQKNPQSAASAFVLRERGAEEGRITAEGGCAPLCPPRAGGETVPGPRRGRGGSAQGDYPPWTVPLARELNMVAPECQPPRPRGRLDQHVSLVSWVGSAIPLKDREDSAQTAQPLHLRAIRLMPGLAGENSLPVYELLCIARAATENRSGTPKFEH